MSRGPLDPWERDIVALLDLAKQKGYLTYEELNTAAPELAPSPEMMDRILMVLDLNGIEIVDGSRGGGAREGRARRARGEATSPTARACSDRRRSALDLPITTEKIDDPVRMYLTQMGEIPLLTRDQEISLAKKIEITRKRYRHVTLDCGVAVAEATSASSRTSPAATSRSTARSASAPPTRSTRTTCRSGCRSTSRPSRSCTPRCAPTWRSWSTTSAPARSAARTSRPASAAAR